MADPTLQSQWQQLVTGFAQRNGLTPTHRQQQFSLTEQNGTHWSLHLPQNSDLIHFYATMRTAISEQILARALTLNDDLQQMRGAWLSLNPQNTLVLNVQLPIEQTDLQALENTLVNTMQLKETLEEQLSQSSATNQPSADWLQSIPV